MNALGRQILLEFYECSPSVLDDCDRIRNLMQEAARESGATIVDTHIHHFNPYGVSGVVVIAESHLTIHTWPEHNYAAVDIFSCGESIDPWVIQDILEKGLASQRISSMELRRGLLPNAVALPTVKSLTSDK